MVEDQTKNSIQSHWTDNGGKLPEQEGIQFAESQADDAFSTILQWLHWRVPFTRGKDRPDEKLYFPTFQPVEGCMARHVPCTKVTFPYDKPAAAS